MFGAMPDPIIESIERAVTQIIYEVPVEEIRATIMGEGHDSGMAYIIYCAARRTIQRQNPDFAAVREEEAAERARPSSIYWDDEGA